jgi:hypothetical protein
VTAFGETKTINQWAEDQRCVVNRHILYKRLFRKWPPERAITKTQRQPRSK